MNILEMNDKQYSKLGLFDESFRNYHWYDQKYHINEKIIRCLENILNEYRAGNIMVDEEGELVLNIDNYVTINNFNYSTYEVSDIKRTLFILEDYIRKD